MLRTKLWLLVSLGALALAGATAAEAQTYGSGNPTQNPSLTSENNLPVMIVEDEGQRFAYEYAVQALAPVATPTAIVVIQGSATKVVRVKKIRVNGVATATGNMQLQLARWSTAGTQGSAVLTALTAVKHDINNLAATAVVSTVGTANYGTQGTGSTIPFNTDRICLATTATGVTCPLEDGFSLHSDQPIVLRGTTDYLVLSGNGSAVPAGGVLDISIETEEDNL